MVDSLLTSRTLEANDDGKVRNLLSLKKEDGWQEIALLPKGDENRFLRFFLERLIEKAPGLKEPLKISLEIIALELFGNCLSHGNLDAERDEIIFRGKLGLEGVLLECQDQGSSFDLSKVPFPDFTGEKMRGFGLYFIQEMADSFTYLPKKEGGWNSYQIEKKFYLESGASVVRPS